MEENTMKYGETVVTEDLITALTLMAVIGMGVTGAVIGISAYKGVKKICGKIHEHKLAKEC